jgi:hypothetical protein
MLVWYVPSPLLLETRLSVVLTALQQATSQVSRHPYWALSSPVFRPLSAPLRVPIKIYHVLCALNCRAPPTLVSLLASPVPAVMRGATLTQRDSMRIKS